MAFFRLDDFSGSCDCIMFGKTYAEFGELIVPESTIMLLGKLESSGDSIQLQAEEVMDLSKVADKLTKSIGVLLDVDNHDHDTVVKLRSILDKHDGNIPVIIYIRINGTPKRFLTDSKIKISNKFISDVHTLLGEESIAYQTL